VLVGGPTPQVRLDRRVAAHLLAEVKALHGRIGGGLLVTTGPRTPADVTDFLREDLAGLPTFFHPWSAADNPYPAILRQADSFVVTSDSVSMVADAVWQGRPVWLLELPPRRRWFMRTPVYKLYRWFGERWCERRESQQPFDRLDRIYRFLAARGWLRPDRDVSAVWRRLTRLGLVQRLGDTSSPSQPVEASRCLNAELDRVLARIAALGEVVNQDSRKAVQRIDLHRPP
ncbi:MAG: ELM1/GtrOC1 family putative glycosyltransferase, partial [Methylococcales bacterium]